MGSVTASAIDQPAVEELDLSKVLYALGDSVRLSMVRQLRDHGECACVSLDLGVAKSTLTNHFRILRESGVIAQRAEGTARLTSLRSDDLERRFPGVLKSVLDAA
jgi:DNA-binding transcriptional ArsR family regulator